MKMPFDPATLLLFATSWTIVMAQEDLLGDDLVGIQLHNWFSTCEISDGGKKTCSGSTSQGLDPTLLDLSGNFFCYVNPVEETKSQIMWFGACPGPLSGCDIAPLNEISVWTMYLNPSNEMYDSLVPTDCVNGACGCDTINPIRGTEWYEDTSLSWCSVDQEDNAPYACNYEAPYEVSIFDNCSITTVVSTPWNENYCTIQANMSAVRANTTAPTMSPTTSSSSIGAWHWSVVAIVAASLLQSIGL